MAASPRCRIWWPKQLQLLPLESGSRSTHLLFGWWFSSADSVDVVVATAVHVDQILLSFPGFHGLQDVLRSANGKMLVRLQDAVTFTILGHCVVDSTGASEMGANKNRGLKGPFEQAEHFPLEEKSFTGINGLAQHEDHGKWRCGCSLLDGIVEARRQSLLESGNWIQLYYRSKTAKSSNARQIPELGHLHLNTNIFAVRAFHVILYDPPTYGRSHFALSSWGVSPKSRTDFKKPNWVKDLQKKRLLLNLDLVILALNCSNAAKLLIDQQVGVSIPVTYFFASILLELVRMVGHAIAICLASTSAIVYVFLQLFHKCLSRRYGNSILQKAFEYSWKNIHIRSCQILYWPVFLQGISLRSSVNVEYAHRAAIQKHSIWSSVAVDILMGVVFGVTVLSHIEAICFWISTVGHYLTDNVLRSGCVWLMGVPAGFKLNTELAELLGMISLNAIQIYSTFWFILGHFLRYIIEGLALSGILLGLTVPMSFCIDILKLATLHITTLRQLVSFLYSRQIQALASLWRLFRGRKLNPLRQRLDSYDYTVEQHVVGSLLFAPVLLLLPTTSVFYIFFTMLTTTIINICITMETMISIIHATPYAELALWLIMRWRFPSGLWFLTVPFSLASSHGGLSLSDEGFTSSGLDEEKTENSINGLRTPLLSELRCNYATLGQVIKQHYTKIFQGVAFSFFKSLAYGVLSGERIPSTMQTYLPPPQPWMDIGTREYWRLCHDALLSCILQR